MVAAQTFDLWSWIYPNKQDESKSKMLNFEEIKKKLLNNYHLNPPKIDSTHSMKQLPVTSMKKKVK